MKISTRISSGFIGLSVLALVCGWAGYYGVSTLSASLKFISGPAWDTADGSMEGSIGVELQMLGVNRIVTKTGDLNASREMIRDGKEMAHEALSRMMSAGLLNQSEVDKVNMAIENYNTSRDDLLSKYEIFARSDESLVKNFYEFQKLMELAEELGDGAVEELRASPDKTISWRSGLKAKWTAADGAMESQIGMLQRIYYYERLTSNIDQANAIEGLGHSLDFLNESIEEIIAHPLFKVRTVTSGTFNGISYSAALEKAYSQHKSDFSIAIENYNSYRMARENYNNIADGFLSYLETVEETGDSKVESEQENITTAINTSYSLVVITVLLSFGIAIVVGGWIIASIVRPMRQVLNAMEDVAEGEGDLTQRLSYQGNDEIGQTVSAFNKFINKIEQVIAEVGRGVNSIEHSATELFVGNTSLSQRTEEQASSLEETASSMEEMTSTVRQNAENAMQANKLATNASALAQNGGNIVINAVQAMSEINNSSKKIGDIIGLIDEIAFQTNLLALNAAVEAARAGEQGRGFAVVASEVRTLAQRSADQSKEIKELILASMEKVENGSELVTRSGESLSEIVDGVKKVSDIVSEIAAASQEQSAGIDQVNKAVLQMDEMTQQNGALVEEAAAASQSMSDQTKHLKNLISFFKVSADKAVN